MKFQNTSIRNILNDALNYNGIIVDVRDRDDFAASHIPMAINLPLDDIQQEKVSLPKGKIIILYCENGGKSAMAARILAEKGYRVINTIGGLKEYKGALTKR